MSITEYWDPDSCQFWDVLGQFWGVWLGQWVIGGSRRHYYGDNTSLSQQFSR